MNGRTVKQPFAATRINQVSMVRKQVMRMRWKNRAEMSYDDVSSITSLLPILAAMTVAQVLLVMTSTTLYPL
jgi:hypothetical protein